MGKLLSMGKYYQIQCFSWNFKKGQYKSHEFDESTESYDKIKQRYINLHV